MLVLRFIHSGIITTNDSRKAKQQQLGFRYTARLNPYQ